MSFVRFNYYKAFYSQFSWKRTDNRILNLNMVFTTVDFHQNGSGHFYSNPIFQNLTHPESWQVFKDMGSFITTIYLIYHASSL